MKKLASKPKNKMAISLIVNIALLFILVTKIGKGEDVLIDAGKALAEEKAAIQAEKATELEKSFAQTERKAELAGSLKGASKASKSINSTMSKIKAANLYEKSAGEVNSFWKLNRYVNPPYQANTIVNEFELAQKTNFVRVYDGINSLKEGGWVMRAEDVAGLTAQQLKEKYALQYLPKYICDVEVDAGAKIHCGVAGEITNWGKGGGAQFDLNADRTVGNFTNQRLIP